MYQQQVQYWSSKHLECCPRDKILSDILQEIVKWQEEGNFIILLADMNEDVVSKDLQIFCQGLHKQFLSCTAALYPHTPMGQQINSGIYVLKTLLDNATGRMLLLGTVMASDQRAL